MFIDDLSGISSQEIKTRGMLQLYGYPVFVYIDFDNILNHKLIEFGWEKTNENSGRLCQRSDDAKRQT